MQQQQLRRHHFELINGLKLPYTQKKLSKFLTGSMTKHIYILIRTYIKSQANLYRYHAI